MSTRNDRYFIVNWLHGHVFSFECPRKGYPFWMDPPPDTGWIDYDEALRNRAFRSGAYAQSVLSREELAAALASARARRALEGL